MKFFLKKEYMLKGASVYFIILVLLFSNLSAMSNTLDTSPQNIQNNDESIHGLLGQSSQLQGEEFINLTDFEDGLCPPSEWELSNNSGQTWEIDKSQPEGNSKFCATIKRRDYKGLHEEWLISKSFDFSKYNEIRMKIAFFTSHYAAKYKDLIDLNITISLDDGKSWKTLWNEDSHSFTESWVWQYAEIVLTEYNDQTNVKIGFQYYSNNMTRPDIQEFSIDSIICLGDSPTNFWSNCGLNETVSWTINYNAGIQFYGDAGDGIPPYRWKWDFGDGKSANIRNPNHKYSDLGTYKVTLSVNDSASPPHYAEDTKTVEIFETDPPDLALKINYPSLGITAIIENTGTLNVTQIAWEIWLDWGLIDVRNRKIKNGTIDFLEAKNKTTIRTDFLILGGFGIVQIKVKANPVNSYPAEIRRTAFKVGPFFIWVSKK